MKLVTLLSLASALLLGAGYLLLRTSQAPIGGIAARPAVTAPVTVVSPTPVALPETTVPAPAVYSKEEFRTLSENALAKLPGKDSLSGLKDADPYQAPLPILKAGEALRPVVEAVHQDESLSEQATVIYRSCAASGDYPDSVRALCLSHFRRLSRKSGKPSPEGFAPSFVRELAGKLNS